MRARVSKTHFYRINVMEVLDEEVGSDIVW
jgi:hypothetical protein